MNQKLLMVFWILICMFCAGCTQQSATGPMQQAEPATVQTTQVPTMTTELTPEPTAVQTIFDEPVSKPPADLGVSVSVQKDPVYLTITTSFDGGKGQDLVQSILVKTTLSTGETVEQSLGKNKGDEITVIGSKGADRVQVAVTFMNGNSYLVADTMIGQSRAETYTEPPIADTTMSTNEEGLYPGPVTQPPNSLSVSVDVDKEPIYRVITGTFRGGHGQSLVSSIEMRAILGSGEAVTKNIANNIGAIGEIQGSDGIDRVQVIVFYKNGDVHKIFEKTFGPRG